MDHHTLEKYEKMWLVFAVILVVLLTISTVMNVVSAMVPSVGVGHGHVGARVDIKNLSATPFANPGLQKTEDGYEAFMVAKAFQFEPAELKVPVGEKIKLYVTSTDVLHGLQIERSNINIQVVPGEVAAVEYTFKKAGTYLVGCNEYCGTGHQNMYSKIIVEEKP